MSYATLAELKAAIRIVDNADDTLLQLALDSASELIDGHCDRSFSVTGEASVRSFSPSGDRIEVDDIYTTDDLAIVFRTVEIPLAVESVSVGYRLEPVNAPEYGEPYTTIVLPTIQPAYAIGGLLVHVTARWGYAAEVPKAVVNACILQASRLFSRRNSPYGIAGSPDMGSELRLLAKLDPDVAVMLSKYVKMEVY